MMYDMAPMGPIWWIGGLLVVVLLLAAGLASLAHLQPQRRRPVAPPEDAPSSSYVTVSRSARSTTRSK